MAITQKKFGHLPCGDEVSVFTLTNGTGLSVEVLSYGAIIKTIALDDGAALKRNLVLGYGELQSYLDDTAYLGATIGRYCSRIANAFFPLSGKTVQMVANEGVNHLHGGQGGFHQRLWSLRRMDDGNEPSLTLKYVSPDGEEGYPGNLHTSVRYQLTSRNELRIHYTARSDKETIVNLANHSYFNLHGDGDRSVLDHRVQINADGFLPVDASLIPEGRIQPVANTPFDMRSAAVIGTAMSSKNEQLKIAGGFDHNWVLNRHTGELREVARASSPLSGIQLTLLTTQPGMQFYTGNQLEAAGFKQHAAFCFETQHYPDSPNQPDFPSTVLRPGETYSQTTVYAFGMTDQ